MTKQQVAQRVLQNGQPLALDKFEWDASARVFSTTENNLVIDFSGEHSVNFTTGSHCTFKTGSDCTFTCQSDCVIVRRDVFEVIQPKPGVTIQLRKLCVVGYDVVTSEPETIEIAGKKYRKNEVEERLAELKEVE